MGFRAVFPGGTVDGKEQVSLTTAEAKRLERREGRHCDPIPTLLFQGSGLGDSSPAVTVAFKGSLDNLSLGLGSALWLPPGFKLEDRGLPSGPLRRTTPHP